MLETSISAPHVSCLQHGPDISMHQHHADGRCYCHEKVLIKIKSDGRLQWNKACMHVPASTVCKQVVKLIWTKLGLMLVKIYVSMCYYHCSWFYLSPSIYICAFTTIVMYISVHIKILGISPFYPTKLVKESGLPPWPTMPKMHSPSTTETRQITPLAGFHGGFADVAMMWWRPHISILPLSSLLSYSG